MIQHYHEQFDNDDVDFGLEAPGQMAVVAVYVHGDAALAGAMTFTLTSGDVEYEVGSITLAGTDGAFYPTHPILMRKGDNLNVAFTNTAATIDVVIVVQDRPLFNF